MLMMEGHSMACYSILLMIAGKGSSMSLTLTAARERASLLSSCFDRAEDRCHECWQASHDVGFDRGLSCIRIQSF